MRPHPRQPRQQINQLGQFDLQLSLPRLRPLREDVEDQLGPVQHLAGKNLLQVPRLGRTQLVVKNDRVRLFVAGRLGQLRRLAAADVGRRHRSLHFLGGPVRHLPARALHEQAQFVQRFPHLPSAAPGGLQSHQKGPLCRPLPVCGDDHPEKLPPPSAFASFSTPVAGGSCPEIASMISKLGTRLSQVN